MKKIVAIIATIFSLCFAQEKVQPMLVVYVSGSNDAGMNKLLGLKLLSALSQSGDYAYVADPVAFQDDIVKAANGGTAQMAQIIQTARQHGADYVCSVTMVEAFGAYSISARIVKVSDSQVVKIGSADRSLKSLEDLTEVSKELANQFMSQASYVPPPLAIPQNIAPPPPQAAVAAAQKQCDKTYNINELLFKIKDGFPGKLKDCSAKLAKDMLLAASPFGKKSAAPEPKSFMRQCAVDGIKNEIPFGFPDADKFVASIDNFVQSMLNAASAGGNLDPKKLVSAVGSMDINGLLNDMKKLAFGNNCIVNEPYEPPAVSASRAGNSDKKSDSDGDEGKRSVYFGIRAGLNLSHTYMEYYDRYYVDRSGDYGSVAGEQLGFVLDIAASSWFHIQPGVMYIQKGMNDGNSDITAHYLEVPFLFSLKFSALRLNAGPYLGLCLSGDYACGGDFGLSMGFGFDLWMIGLWL